jgi:hypothetical protein
MLLCFIAHHNLPDLISAENFLFPVLRFALNGGHIQSIMEIQFAVSRELNIVLEKVFL